MMRFHIPRFQIGELNRIKGYGWVTLSALLLIMPVYLPHACWWLVFIAHLPLFYGIFTCVYTAWHGLWWGLLYWAGHVYALFFVVAEHGYGTLRLLVPLFLILYCAAYSAFAFYSAARLSYQKTYMVKGVMWVMCISAYYLIMRYGALWIIGLKTGYPLALPLLPLAEYPEFLRALPYLHSSGLLLCLLSFAMGVAYYLVTKHAWVWLLNICMLIPFGSGFFVTTKNRSIPAYAVPCALILPPIKGGRHPRDCAQDIALYINRACARNQKASILILPESSYPFALNMHPDALELWGINALHDGQYLIIGSYAQEGESLYNGIYCINNCRIIFDYVKKCRMPFTEYIPYPWSMLTCARTLFLKNRQGFSAKESSRLLTLNSTWRVQLALCSEFFFDAYDNQCTFPILALVNDSWFSCLYIRHLMYLFARYMAIERSRDIMYSSYTYGACIDTQGTTWLLYSD